MTETTPEFSRFVSVKAIHGSGLTQDIEATPDERVFLARRLQLSALHELSATLHLKPVRGDSMIEVKGTLHARVTQSCIMTLDPVESTVSESFSALFAPPELIDGGSPDDHAVVGELEDSPEPYDHDAINLGELVAQHLSLALDPYPRSAAAALKISPDSSLETKKVSQNPFAALARLKTKQ